MNCDNDKCNSDRVMSISGKCSDMFNCNYNNKTYNGYVPQTIIIGNGGYGDYIRFEFCLECGKIQGKFPIKEDVVMDLMEEDEGHNKRMESQDDN